MAGIVALQVEYIIVNIFLKVGNAMSVNIMLSFLSNYHLLNGRPTATKYYGDAGYVVEGEHTNEAALRYVYDKFGLDRYFCFCSKMIQKEIDYVDENSTTKSITHNNLFLERIAQHIPNIADITEFIDYTEAELSSASVLKKDNGDKDTAADLTSVKDMAGAITSFANPYLQQGTEVVLYLDTTGGFRHANTLMLAVVELLKYSGITIGNILYSNYNRDNFDENGNRVPLGKIEDITDIHGVMQLVAGAEAFISYGSAEVLKKCFVGKKKSGELISLLNAMESFSNALSLCRSGMLSSEVKNLRNRIAAFKNSSGDGLQESLFKQLLLQRIEKEYVDIGDGSNKLQIIRWCIDKGYLQQGMTLYTEWVPVLIVDNGLIAPAKSDIRDKCQSECKKYESWEKYLLSYYKEGHCTDIRRGDSDEDVRWKYIKDMFNKKRLITKMSSNSSAAQLAREYNRIRALRNKINHANDERLDIIQINKNLLEYINKLEKVLNDFSK